MTGEEFKKLIDGMTAELIGRVTGRSASQIAAYKGGKVTIPYEVARTAQDLAAYIAKLQTATAKPGEPAAGFRRVVDGLTYDTATSRRIAAWENGSPRNDFRYCEEDLYQTRAGRFFLHGKGGPMSQWGRSTGDGVTWGENIMPLDQDDAKAWLLDRQLCKEFEALFGEIPEAL